MGRSRDDQICIRSGLALALAACSQADDQTAEDQMDDTMDQVAEASDDMGHEEMAEDMADDAMDSMDDMAEAADDMMEEATFFTSHLIFLAVKFICRVIFDVAGPHRPWQTTRGVRGHYHHLQE